MTAAEPQTMTRPSIAQELRESITDGWSADARAADPDVALSAAAALDDFTETLQVICTAAGRFSLDPCEHAQNCVRDMAQIASDVLKAYGIIPRRNLESDPI